MTEEIFKTNIYIPSVRCALDDTQEASYPGVSKELANEAINKGYMSSPSEID